MKYIEDYTDKELLLSCYAYRNNPKLRTVPIADLYGFLTNETPSDDGSDWGEYTVKDCLPLVIEDDVLADVTESIREHGVRSPLGVDEDGWLVDGFHRLVAMDTLGYTEAPCWFADSFEEALDLSEFWFHNRLRDDGTELVPRP